MKTDRIKLEKLIQVDSGYAFESGLFNETEGMPIIRIRDVGKNFSTTLYNGEYDERYLVQNGDYLITMDGEFRINEWKGGQALLNQRVCRIIATSPILDSRYLYHLLPRELTKSLSLFPPSKLNKKSPTCWIRRRR